jgi:hypothetical protein
MKKITPFNADFVVQHLPSKGWPLWRYYRPLKKCAGCIIANNEVMVSALSQYIAQITHGMTLVVNQQSSFSRYFQYPESLADIRRF